MRCTVDQANETTKRQTVPERETVVIKVGADASALRLAAAMHVVPSSTSGEGGATGPRFRFSFDKLLLFQAFDPESILLAWDDADNLLGVLVYTRDERKFNRFSRSFRGGICQRAVKSAVGFYGFQFTKFIKAFRSMTGIAAASDEAKPSGPFGKIWVLIVAEEARGMGLATRLVKECVTRFKERESGELRVTVKTDNAPAIKVYEKCGFKRIGTCEESSGHSYVMSLDPDGS